MADLSELPRYCRGCGAIYAAAERACPRCGLPWQIPQVTSTLGLATILTELQEWRRDGVIDQAAYARLRARYEARLPRPEPRATEVAQERSVPLPPRPGGAAPWLAERQTDVLLYLGAFCLGAAALIFVRYQGTAIGPAARVILLAAFTALFLGAGLLVRRWERFRDAGQVFLALGGLCLPLDVIMAYFELLRARGVPGDAVWLAGSALCLLCYGALAWRGFGRFYAALAAGALVSGWGALAALLGLPPAWDGAWFMALATSAALALSRSRRVSRAAIGGVAALAAVALVAAEVAAASGPDRAPLPAALALLTLALCGLTLRSRQPAPALAATTALLATSIAALWAAGVPAVWDVYPPLLLGALVAGLLWRWAGRAPSFAATARAYACACACWPALFAPLLLDGWHGATAFLPSAAILAALAWTARAHGFGVLLAERRDPVVEELAPAEGFVLGWAAAASAFAALGYAQHALGVAAPDTGWAFVTVATGAALALGWAHRGAGEARFLLLVSLAATLVALQPLSRFVGQDAVFLAVPAAAFLVAALRSRRWLLALLAATLAAGAQAAAWDAAALPYWSLALAYAAEGLVLFGALTPFRRYREGQERDLVAALLSWAPGILAIIVAAAAWNATLFDGSVNPVRTLAYDVLAALIFLPAPLLAWEGWRFGKHWLLLPASALALLAGLLALAIAEPANIQAYTVPLGLYLLAVGLLRRQAPPITPDLCWHEWVVIIGGACLTLPQAAQSFEPGGADWGLILLGEGVGFLAIALRLRSRALLAAGALTLGGVAVRWLIEVGDTIPYWLTLGLVGFALVSVALLVALAHDHWDALRRRMLRWWRHPAAQP